MSDSAVDKLRDALVQARLEHRVLAFAYAWLYLIEPPAQDPDRILALIDTDNVAMHLSDGSTITTPDEIRAWYAKTAGAVQASSHRITTLAVAPGPDNTVLAAIEFAWQGVAPGDQPMTARTHHDWVLVDLGEPQLRLREFTVSAVRPFAPATAEDALADHAGAD